LRLCRGKRVDMAAVSFQNVTKSFGSRAVFTGVSFALASGARCGLIGPNGAGKSTLLKLLMGALRPDAGDILVDGLAPWRPSARGRAGFLPEGAPLMGDLTVREHLVLAARLRGLPPGELSAEEDRLTEALALADFYRRPAAGLSQGQKRRAALASALWVRRLSWPWTSPPAAWTPRKPPACWTFYGACLPIPP